MPISFKINEEASYFVAVWTGQVTQDEMVETYCTFLDSNDSMGHFRELCDLSDVDLSEIKLQGLRELSAVIRDCCKRNEIGDARCACFVPAEINQSVMELYDLVSKESAEETRVYSNIDNAMTWLLC